MAKALKHGLNKAAITRMAGNIARADSTFDEEGFVSAAMRGLRPLELKERVWHVVDVLGAHLPKNPRRAISTLVKAGTTWDRGDPKDPLRGFAAWPVIEFVGVHGLDDFDASMEALRSLTSLFSSEFAIREFIEKDPQRALGIIETWLDDEDEHVRRLVSEGTRPRLPWGKRLRLFQENPKPVLDLLRPLKDDPSEYVRRSVANNLNDIAKDHPELVVSTCERWSKGATEDVQWIIRHATRTLVKDGNPKVLKLLGYDPDAKLTVSGLRLTPKKLKLGETLSFSFSVQSKSKTQQQLMVDYAIHHVRNSGETTAKVFKLKKLTLNAAADVPLSKSHAIKPISTRKYYAGKHTVEILINGRSRAVADFQLSV